jgi:hypothetical protein
MRCRKSSSSCCAGPGFPWAGAAGAGWWAQSRSRPAWARGACVLAAAAPAPGVALHRVGFSGRRHRQLLAQPGVLVGREHAVGRARLGEHLAALEDHMVLVGVQRHTGAASWPRTARRGPGLGLVVVVGKTACTPSAGPAGARHRRLPRAHDEAHPAPWATQLTQMASSSTSAVADELHAPVGAGQRVEDVACRRQRRTMHLLALRQRVVQGGMVVVRAGRGGTRPGRWRKRAPCSPLKLDNVFRFCAHQPDATVPDRHARHGDESFARSVVYLCEHSERGALGLVINKPSDIKLKNLFDKVDLSCAARTWPSSRCSSGRPGADRARFCAARAHARRHRKSRRVRLCLDAWRFLVAWR